MPGTELGPGWYSSSSILTTTRWWGIVVVFFSLLFVKNVYSSERASPLSLLRQIAGGLYFDQVFQVKAKSSCGVVSGAYEMLALPA